MKRLDYYLQKARIKQIAPFIIDGQQILDIGSAGGGMFRWLSDQKIDFSGIGIEPEIPTEIEKSGYKILKAKFPSSRITGRQFDVITALAVLEHVPVQQLKEFAAACNQHLKPGGLLLITVPSRLVDFIIKPLIWLGLMDGNRVDQHYGYDSALTIPLFSGEGFELKKHSTFQMGLNNLYVFRKNYPNKST
ncbi:MAG: class I SAM-dependent methyltransferase [Chitinophagales bacterium]